MTPRQLILLVLTLMVGIGATICGFLLIGQGGISMSAEDFGGLALVGFGLREILSLV